jgi:hypothetical protein
MELAANYNAEDQENPDKRLYFVGVGSVYVYLSGEAGDIGKLGR